MAVVSQLAAGALVYAMLMCILNAADARVHLIRAFGRLRQQKPF
jgi:hypothetical protein